MLESENINFEQTV